MALLECGRNEICGLKIGGAKAVYLISRTALPEDTAFTTGSDYTYVSYTTISSSASLSSRWVEFEFYEDTISSGTEDNLGDAGSKFQQVTIEGFATVIGDSQKCLEDLRETCKVYAIVEYNNGNAVLYGYDQRLKSRAALEGQVSEEGGTAKTDRNGYMVSLTGQMAEIARTYVGSIILSDGTTKVFT